MMDNSTEFFVGLASIAVLKYSLSYILHKKTGSPKHLQCVGKVSRLTVYPMKSCRGVHTESADVDETGLLSVDGIQDRYIMVAKQDGECLTARQIPKMVLVTPSFHGDFIHLDAPGMTTLKIPRKLKETRNSTCSVFGQILPGIDFGPEAAEWICEVLGKPGLRLVATSLDMQKREMWKGDDAYSKVTPEGTKISYQDLSPFHLLSEETVCDLNRRLTKQVTMENFRPNIVVSKCKAYDEFDWEEIYIGDVKYTQLYRCERCTFPSVDPTTGVRDITDNPRKTMMKYLPNGLANSGPTLGIMLRADNRGTIHVGDPVYVLRKSANKYYMF